MKLFDRSRNMADYKRDWLDCVRNTVEDLTEIELENSDDSLILILTSKFQIPPIKLESPYRKDGSETKKDITKDSRFLAYGDSRPIYKKAKVIYVHIPFEGREDLFIISPSTFTSVCPIGEISNKEIIFSFDFFPDIDNTESVKKNIENAISLLKKYTEWMNRDIEEFNKSLYAIISLTLMKRRQDLEKSKEIINGLGIPLKEKHSLEAGFVKPVSKIEIKIESSHENQDRVLDVEIYDGITKYVNSLGINLERCKSQVRSLDEESLRDTFFMALNSAYKGLVSTEAFNHSGKTDILIRYEDNNLYISEFKIWRGDSYFTEGINQLLDNLTWRDSKCSYVIFSRNSDFDNVIAKSQELISKHPNYLQLLSKVSDNCIRFKLKNKNHSQKSIFLTLHLFNLS